MTDLNHAHRTGTNLPRHLRRAPALDPRTAAEVAHRLVADALTGACIEHGGEWFDTSTVRVRRHDGAPESIALVIADGTRGESILATVLIATTPIGA